MKSLAIPDKVRDNYGEQKNLEFTLRKVTNLSMEVGDGCQDLWHNLSTCKHQTDWNTCHVTILPLHLPTWQADNPLDQPCVAVPRSEQGFEDQAFILDRTQRGDLSLQRRTFLPNAAKPGEVREAAARPGEDFYLSLRYWTKL